MAKSNVLADHLSCLPPGYSYVPIQMISELYSARKGLRRGTMFPELDLPLGVYGNNFGETFCSCKSEEGENKDGK